MTISDRKKAPGKKRKRMNDWGPNERKLLAGEGRK